FHGSDRSLNRPSSGGGAGRFVFADELRHGLGGPRSLLEPGGQLLGPELDQGGGAAGIVHADLLDEATVARRLHVGDHDTVEGAFLAAVAGEADLDCHAVLLPEGQRGRPGSPGILGIIGPEPSCFNTFFVCVNCLISRFTSATDVPLPLAMRFRRLAFRSWTFLRSARVIELMIASTRVNSSSAPERSAPRSIFFTPSIVVSTTPETGSRRAKPCAVATASWPVMASATRSTWCGVIAAAMRSSSRMSSSSTVCRPAVSTTTVSRPRARAAATPSRAI